MEAGRVSLIHAKDNGDPPRSNPHYLCRMRLDLKTVLRSVGVAIPILIALALGRLLSPWLPQFAAWVNTMGVWAPVAFVATYVVVVVCMLPACSMSFIFPPSILLWSIPPIAGGLGGGVLVWATADAAVKVIATQAASSLKAGNWDITNSGDGRVTSASGKSLPDTCER